MSLSLVLTGIVSISMTVLVLLPSLDSHVNAVTNVNNTYSSKNKVFSMKIPDNWAQRGLAPEVVLFTPSQFSELLINYSDFDKQMKDEGALVRVQKDWFYPIENTPFDTYVKWKIAENSGIHVTSMQNVTLSGEPGVKIYGDGIDPFNGIKFVQYLVWHDEEPYFLEYMANQKDYQKYLPQFEQMIKTFKFSK